MAFLAKCERPAISAFHQFKIAVARTSGGDDFIIIKRQASIGVGETERSGSRYAIFQQCDRKKPMPQSPYGEFNHSYFAFESMREFFGTVNLA